MWRTFYNPPSAPGVVWLSNQMPPNLVTILSTRYLHKSLTQVSERGILGLLRQLGRDREDIALQESRDLEDVDLQEQSDLAQIAADRCEHRSNS